MGWFEDAVDTVNDIGSDVGDFVSDSVGGLGSAIADGNTWARENVPLVKEIEDFGVGAYDVASDVVDGTASFASGINTWARENVPAYSTVQDTFSDAYKGVMNSNPITSTMKKQIERTLIMTLYVPAKTRRTYRIIEEYDKNVKTLASKVKSKITSINGKIDEEIKGDFSKAIQETVKSKNSQWDHLV